MSFWGEWHRRLAPNGYVVAFPAREVLTFLIPADAWREAAVNQAMSHLVQITLFALLISGWVLRGIRRSSLDARWTVRAQDGLRYQFAVWRRTTTQLSRGRVGGIVLRFGAPKGVQFLVRRKTGFDQIVESLRLVEQPLMSDEKFDSHFRIECEDKQLLNAARARPDLLTLVTALSKRLVADRSELAELRCEDGNLDLLIDCDLADAGAENAEHDAVAWLRPVVDAISRLPPNDAKRFNRGLAARFVFVSIFMIGVSGGFTVWAFFTRRMVEGSNLLRFSVPYSFAALGAALYLTLLWLRHSPGWHRVLTVCLLVGVPGFLCCGAMAARWLDLSLPQGAPEVIPCLPAHLSDGIVSFYDSSDKRTWDVSSILLSESAYERLQSSWGNEESRPAILLRYPGALGLPWVEVISETASSNASTPSEAAQ